MTKKEMALQTARAILFESHVPLAQRELAKEIQRRMPHLSNHRQQFDVWAAAAQRVFADEVHVNNPRDVDRVRRGILERDERIAVRLEQAFNELLPADPCELTRHANDREQFGRDVGAATKAVRALVEIDKVRIVLLRLTDLAPDAAAKTDEELDATIRLMGKAMAEFSVQQRAQIIEMARTVGREQDDLVSLADFGLPDGLT